MDYEGIKTLLRKANERFPRLRHLWLDAGYRGEDKGADWVRKSLGWSVDIVERPKKPAPEKVMMAWAAEWAKEGVAVDWRKLMPPEGFVVLPRRNPSLSAIAPAAPTSRWACLCRGTQIPAFNEYRLAAKHRRAHPPNELSLLRVANSLERRKA